MSSYFRQEFETAFKLKHSDANFSYETMFKLLIIAAKYCVAIACPNTCDAELFVDVILESCLCNMQNIEFIREVRLLYGHDDTTDFQAEMLRDIYATRKFKELYGFEEISGEVVAKGMSLVIEKRKEQCIDKKTPYISLLYELINHHEDYQFP